MNFFRILDRPGLRPFVINDHEVKKSTEKYSLNSIFVESLEFKDGTIFVKYENN